MLNINNKEGISLIKLLKRKPKPIIDHYRSHDYINAKIQVTKSFPNSFISQVEEMKRLYGSKFHVMYMAEVTQTQLRDTNNGEIKLNPFLLEYMTRGFIDAIAHMQEDLPEGVYEYIENKTDTFFYTCIEHSTGTKVKF